MRDGAIHYVRRKTGQRMTVHLEPCMREIIGRYAPRTRDTPYLFPVLTAEDPARAYAQYQVALNYYNRLLKSLRRCWGWTPGFRPTPRVTAGRRRPATTMCRCR